MTAYEHLKIRHGHGRTIHNKEININVSKIFELNYKYFYGGGKMAIGGKIREAFSNKGEILSFINKIESEKLAILVHFLNSLDKDRLNSFWNGITLASEDDAISFINKLTNPKSI